MTAKLKTVTLGCKVNQYESQSMQSTLRRNGYTLVGEESPADVYIINTCTVTNFSDRKARQLVRKTTRANPEAKVIVTGCYAESAKEVIEQIPEVSLVFGNKEKSDLLDYLDKLPKHGRLPSQCITYGHTFRKGLDPEYDKATDRFRKLFGITHSNNDSGRSSRVNGYTDVRRIPTQKLEEHCKTKLADRASKMATVRLGDEISLPRPRGTEATQGFHAYAKGKKLKPLDLDPGAKDWEAVAYDVSEEAKTKRPGLYYWSKRYLHHHGILKIKGKSTSG